MQDEPFVYIFDVQFWCENMRILQGEYGAWIEFFKLNGCCVNSATEDPSIDWHRDALCDASSVNPASGHLDNFYGVR